MFNALAADTMVCWNASFIRPADVTVVVGDRVEGTDTVMLKAEPEDVPPIEPVPLEYTLI